MTEYHNVDITIAAENGTEKQELKDMIRGAIDASENSDLDHCVMISKVEEVEQ